MEGQGSKTKQQTTNKADGKAEDKRSRYVWTTAEEDMLVACLKELKSKGWKSDNSFKAGYLLQLEIMMKESFPDSLLRADKEIKSKLTVWKKDFSALFSLFRSSGASIGEKNMIQVERKEIWDEYVKVHPEILKLRRKDFPYYEDWEDVFGTDRATGDGAEDVTAALQDIVNEPTHFIEMGEGSNANARNNPTNDRGKQHVEVDDDGEPETESNSDGKYKKPLKGNKRKSLESSEDGKALIGTLDRYITSSNLQFEMIVGVMSAPTPAPIDPLIPQRENIYNLVEKMIEFTELEKMVLINKLTHDPMSGEQFLRLKEESRFTFLRWLLN